MNWNSKFDNNMYSNFEVKSGALPNIIFGMLYIILKLGKLEVQSFKHDANQSFNKEIMHIISNLDKEK